MKKILLFAFAMICMVTTSSAQTFDSETQIISAGLGVSSDYGGIPVYVSYENGIKDFNDVSHIGIGGMMGFGTDKVMDVKWNYFVIAALANYHYTGVAKCDFYGGVKLGYETASVKADEKYSDGDIFFAAQVGARYYFSDSWAINAELGYGLAVLGIGATYKF